MSELSISLPSGFVPSVKAGDSVSKGTVLAQKTTIDEFRLNIAESLATPVKKARHTLKKSPGETVTAGEVVALKKRLFGFKKKAIVSHITGTISRFERDTGILVITASDKRVAGTIISPVDGTVALCDNEKIIIASATRSVAGKNSAGAVGTGEIFVLNEPFVQQVTDLESGNLLYLIGSDVIGKVVIGGSFPREVLLKSIGLGVGGIIGTNISDEDLRYLEERKHQTPVISVTAETAEKIASWKGKKVYLDAPTRTIIFLNA